MGVEAVGGIMADMVDSREAWGAEVLPGSVEARPLKGGRESLTFDDGLHVALC